MASYDCHLRGHNVVLKMAMLQVQCSQVRWNLRSLVCGDNSDGKGNGIAECKTVIVIRAACGCSRYLRKNCDCIVMR